MELWIQPETMVSLAGNQIIDSLFSFQVWWKLDYWCQFCFRLTFMCFFAVCLAKVIFGCKIPHVSKKPCHLLSFWCSLGRGHGVLWCYCFVMMLV